MENLSSSGAHEPVGSVPLPGTTISTGAIYPAEHPDLEQKLKAFDIVTSQYRQDLNVFWIRANFFLVVQSGLLAVLTTRMMDLSIRLTLCGVGLSMAMFWYVVNKGSIYWITTWRACVVQIDRDINPYNSFSVEQLEVARQSTFARFRPTAVTQYFPLVFAAAWVTLAIEALVD